MISNREIFYKHLGLPSGNPLGIEIVRASGIFLYDSEGKDYIDLVSGVSVSNTGHLHPQVVKAVNQQVEKYMHLMVYGEYIQSPQVQLALKLTQNLPDQLESVYFVNSGSEAIEGAMKLAKRYTKRTGIISFKNAYHGGTQGALSVLGNENLKRAFRPLLPDIKHLRFNDAEDLQHITNQTACVIAETVQAEAGIILPDIGFLNALRKRCDETGTLLVIDDIQMGMGRSGKLFSFENFGIVPDILALAKGLGGGMPLGAFIASKKIMKSLTFEPELGHITTFGGHPVSCAAAIASLDVILKNKLCEVAETKGQMFEEALTGHSKITGIRRSGLMLGLDFSRDIPLESFMINFLKNGLITDFFLFRDHAFRIAPPLTISNEEVELTLTKIKNALDNL